MTSVTPNPAVLPPNSLTVKMEPSMSTNPNKKSVDEARLQVLQKHKREILDKVKFCDVSKTLIACGLFSKEECFEICKLPVAQQMVLCFQKVHDIMDILICQKSTNSSKESEEGHKNANEEKQNELVKDIWINFLKSLKYEHPHLAFKLESEVEKYPDFKLKRKVSSGIKLKKEDIGAPTSFHHVQHAGLISRAKSADVVNEIRESSTKKLNAQESDPDLLEFFKRAGVEDRHLTNPVTRNIIFKFIKDNGGMEAIRKEVCGPLKKSSVSESNLAKMKEREQTLASPTSSKKESSKGLTSPLPPSVPFQPTPKPTLNLFYF